MSCCADASCALDDRNLHPGSGGTNLRDAELRASARAVGENLFQNDFIVPEMHCAGCIAKIERHLSALSGVGRARANLSLKRVSVTWDARETSPLRVEEAIAGLGFTPSPFDLADSARPDDKKGRELLSALAVSGFAAMNIMLLSVSVWAGAERETAQLFHLISGLIAVPAVLFAGRPFFSSAAKALRHGRLNMDVPISLAVSLALGMSLFESFTGGGEAYFDAAVSLLFFLLIGRTLDHAMRERARGAVRRLASMTTKGATVLDEEGRAVFSPVSAIVPGMTVRVAAGERLPVDGRIIGGAADFDRSMVTGESAPARFRAGEEIEAGALNLTGTVDIAALRPAENSFVAEIVRLMEAAEGGRSRYVRVADRMARIYAPAVHLLAFFTFIGWMVASGGAWHSSVYAAISVLIITCPCALGLAVPVVHVIAATRLFRDGVLMKDGGALERLAETGVVLFDKTGTLTEGVSHISMAEGEKGLFGTAYLLASRSRHPASRGIAAFLDAQSPSFESESRTQPVADVREEPGNGIEMTLRGQKYRLGRRDWVAEIANGALPDEGDVFCAGAQGPGLSFRLEEAVRHDAKAAIDALKVGGLRVALLSGDGERPVARLARALDIEALSFGNTPQDKVRKIADFAGAGQKVLMVGDGLNDAAALAAGHASMAPASACDVGRLAADFVYTRNALGAVPAAYGIARKSAVLVKQNFALALLYNCIAVPLAVAGVVTPLIAALAMSASSIVVIANSMRLNFENRREKGVVPEESLPHRTEGGFRATSALDGSR